MIQREGKVSEEYWDEILKEVVEEKKDPMFTNEIWEKMKDKHGYPESKSSLEIKLFNLRREGYIKSVLRRKKQAWMFPSGEELLILTETKIIDAAIAKLFEQSLRIPSLKEVKTETRKNPWSGGNDSLINERLKKASSLINNIDHTIQESIEQEHSNLGNKTTAHLSEELILDRIGESIEHFDILIIMRFIRIQKKRYSRE